jgi:hypothetical protein
LALFKDSTKNQSASEREDSRSQAGTPEDSSREATNRTIKDSRTFQREVAILEVVVRDASEELNSSRDRRQEPLNSPENLAPQS